MVLTFENGCVSERAKGNKMHAKICEEHLYRYIQVFALILSVITELLLLT